MKFKYAFFIPPQIMGSRKLSSMEKLIVAILITANKELSITEVAANFSESYEMVENTIRNMIEKKALVCRDGTIALVDSFVFACNNKGIKVKADIGTDKVNFEKVKDCFVKVFPQITVATDKKALGQLSGIACASAPAELWIRYFTAIKNDDFHQETKYKHITLEYVTRPQTVEKFWKFTTYEIKPQKRTPVKLT
jgi:hypothetical protein